MLLLVQYRRDNNFLINISDQFSFLCSELGCVFLQQSRKCDKVMHVYEHSSQVCGTSAVGGWYYIPSSHSPATMILPILCYIDLFLWEDIGLGLFKALSKDIL